MRHAIETESESAAAAAYIPEFNVEIFLCQINIRKE